MRSSQRRTGAGVTTGRWVASLTICTLVVGGALMIPSTAHAACGFSQTLSPKQVGHIGIPEPVDGGPEDCAQITYTGAQWVLPAGTSAGNFQFLDSNPDGGAGILGDIVQLSNSATNATITAVSDNDDGGVDLSQLPVPDAGLLFPPFNSEGFIWRVPMTVPNFFTDGGTAILRTQIDFGSDNDMTVSPLSDFLFTQPIPAAPPVAFGALALILMGAGIYFVKRQRFIAR